MAVAIKDEECHVVEPITSTTTSLSHILSPETIEAIKAKLGPNIGAVDEPISETTVDLLKIIEVIDAGPRGVQGEVGSQGIQGEQGVQGERGLAGVSSTSPYAIAFEGEVLQLNIGYYVDSNVNVNLPNLNLFNRGEFVSILSEYKTPGQITTFGMQQIEVEDGVNNTVLSLSYDQNLILIHNGTKWLLFVNQVVKGGDF